MEKAQMQLPKRPIIKEYFDVLSTGEGRILLVREDEILIRLKEQSGKKMLEYLFEYLNGQCEIPEIVEAMKTRTGMEKENVLQFLEKLHQSGVIEDASEKIPLCFNHDELPLLQPQLNFFSRYPEPKFSYQEKLKKSCISIIGSGDLSNIIALSLAKSGVGKLVGISLGNTSVKKTLINHINPYVEVEEHFIDPTETLQLEDHIAGSDIIAAALDKLNPTLLYKLNDLCIKHRIPWHMCSNIGGLKGMVGPFFIPFETPCYRCLNLRLKSNMDYWQDYRKWEEWFVERPFFETLNFSNLGPFTGIIGSLAALEIIKHLLNFHPQTYGKFMSVNLDIQNISEFGFNLHTFLKIPDCPVCDKKVKFGEGK